MAGDGPRRIVIKRPRKVVNGHHAGSWKIALADFMTALMALFLVLWLLATASPQELQGIAEYFRTPLSVAMAGGDRDTASTSAIPGGGPDPAHSEGEVARVDLRQQSRSADKRRELVNLRERLEAVIAADPDLQAIREQIQLEMTQEGLRIQLVDTDRRPMFELGSDRVAPYMRDLLRAIAPLLNDVPNNLSIHGHTDSLPFVGGGEDYTNWELSTDRANASRRELVAGGLENGKLLRVAGMADRVTVPGTEPGDPVNRRITLVVLTREAADNMRARSGFDGLAGDAPEPSPGAGD